MLVLSGESKPAVASLLLCRLRFSSLSFPGLSVKDLLSLSSLNSVSILVISASFAPIRDGVLAAKSEVLIESIKSPKSLKSKRLETDLLDDPLVEPLDNPLDDVGYILRVGSLDNPLDEVLDNPLDEPMDGALDDPLDGALFPPLLIGCKWFINAIIFGIFNGVA